MAIEKLLFGSTGHESTRTIFGAAALGDVDQAAADDALQLLLRHGVNHIDTAASYGDAELRIGPWMAEHRSAFFLATKTGERERGAAHDEIRRSLERLRVDSVDLIQLHNLVDRGEWETALGTGGALEAAVAARDEGLVRFIGVTGHGLEVARRHLESLEVFPFDSVLLPYTYVQLQDRAYADAVDELLETCAARGVAVQTIKSLSKGRWRSGEHTAAPWYEPLTDRHAIETAVSWTLGTPGIFLNTVSDLALLPLVLDAAEALSPGPSVRPSDEAMDALVAEQQMTPLFDAANPV